VSVIKRVRGLSLRTRIAALTAGAVAVAVLVVVLAAYILAERELRSQVDEGLIRRVIAGRAGIGGFADDPTRVRRGSPYFDEVFGLDNAVQVILANGQVLVSASPTQRLPVSERDLEVASGFAREYLHDETVRGVHLRVITAQIVPGQAVQIARALVEVDATLRGFAFVLSALAALGVAAAAGAGLLVARRAVTPVERLTAAAEHVARTKELSARIDAHRADELGRLARAFNEMLQALDTSREQQRRLVADASHELRTPLTSLRTNIEVLSRVTDIGPDDRERLLADVSSELEELSTLVAELVELATEQRDEDTEEPMELHLDEVVASAVERTQRRAEQPVVLDSAPVPVHGRPLALERAVTNLLDNAVKWGPPDGPIDVTVNMNGEGMARVEVLDRGPGIDEEDRARVFDRFFRAMSARSMPGSGLGLSIVKHVVEQHGGRVWANERPGGGAAIGFEIPAALTGAISSDS
jgi:two-component system, OmpR family, sensor histidine kinase MprB